MIPLAVPNLDGNEARYLLECIESTYVSSVGPFVDRLEQVVADATGSVAAVATSSGTSGLHVALTALGVHHGDLVIIPTFTFIATANAVAQCGASPWLIDMDIDSWTLDPAILEKELDDCCRRSDGVVTHVPTGRRVAAITVVYTLGTPGNMDRINAIAGAWGLPVVADAAAAIGASYRGGNIGGLASLSVASFNGNKTVTCGGGGAVFGDDVELLAKVRHLSTTARVGTAYDHDLVGFNYRMTNVQAALGCAQFERLDQFLQRKQEVYTAYSKLADEIDGFSSFPTPQWAESAHWFSGVVAPSAHDAELGRTHLREEGIEARSFWKPVHLQAPYAASPRSLTAISDALWERIVVLPSSTGISNEELTLVVNSVKAWGLD